MVLHVDPQDRADPFIGHDPFPDSRRLLLFAALGLAVAAFQLARRIELVFIAQAAHEAAADTGNLGRIEGHALPLGHADGNGLEVAQEGGAAQGPSAAANAADHLGFIAQTDLAQLDTRAEDRGQVADEFTEVDTAICRKEKNNLAHIEGIVDINEFHGQFMLGDFGQADTESFLFPFFIFFHLANVFRRRLADNRLQRLDDFRRIDTARGNDDMAEFHAPCRFDDDAVVQFEFDIGGIEIIYLSGRFKAYTYNDQLKSSFKPYGTDTDVIPDQADVDVARYRLQGFVEHLGNSKDPFICPIRQ